MKINWFSTIAVVSCLALNEVGCNRSESAGRNNTLSEHSHRKGKLFSVFHVVTFPNDPCIGNNKNGTCYTPAECSAKGGNNVGTCAGGYGVCCTFTLNCGGVSSENCTYFDSSGVTSGSCGAKVCPCGNGICQMRLDFDTFTIAGPSTNTNSVTKAFKQAGVIVESGTIPISDSSQCLTDSFSVTNGGGGINPPTICGTNTGEHMYIDVCHDQCSKLMFSLGSTAYFTNIPTRSWSIKVTQYSCRYSNLAPRGCTQYFFDSTSNDIQSFNYNNGNGNHLAQQDQAICIRRERGNCRICYYAVAQTDFQTAGSSGTSKGFNKGKVCGSYFSSSSFGFDFVHIPGAEKATTGAQVGSNICGRNCGLLTTGTGGGDGGGGEGGMGSTPPPRGRRDVSEEDVRPMARSGTLAGGKSICSSKQPFLLNFRSDAFEMLDEAKAQNTGFRLRYTQDAINCP